LPDLVLYGRAGCHLCDEMQAGLADLLRERGLSFRVIDVDSDPALGECYGHLLPVLTLGDEMICHYFLDPQAVLKRLGT
jgi:hypothetical protein